MKITGPSGPTTTGAAPTAKRASGAGFAVGGPAAPTAAAEAAPAAATSAVSSVEALLALQEVDGPLERRRKAVRRADRILDVLDELKIALLDGRLPHSALHRLAAAVREERITADDPRLDSLLTQIETRAKVELVKLEVARRAA